MEDVRYYLAHPLLHLELADRAHGDTQNAELKALIEKAKPTLQKHLDRAEELQKKLGNATT